MRARQPGAAVVKVMTGRDSPSVRVLVPDVKVLDRGFHDATLVDMGDVEGPDVSVADLSLLHLQWPLPVVFGMARQQLELKQLRHACKKRYRGTQLDACTFCRKMIKLDMARHVVNYHLELAPALVLPGLMVHSMEGYATGLYGSHASGTCGVDNCEGG